MNKIHLGHTGIEKSKAKARNAVFWPSMTKDIEDFVSKCKDCLKYQSAQQREPFHMKEIPELPWQVVASDIGEYKGESFLVVIDYYSKYIESVKMPGKKASNVIKGLDEIFSRHGYPENMISDNMPFNSAHSKCANMPNSVT